MIVPRVSQGVKLRSRSDAMLEPNATSATRHCRAGALIFSPPTNDAWIVEKYHACGLLAGIVAY